MPIVELLFFPDCPNVPAARELLGRAMAQAGLRPVWAEHDVTNPEAPDYTRGFGSPTILVDGSDVTGSAPSTEGSSCRIYVGSDVRGVPPLKSVSDACGCTTTSGRT
jgi:mercuric ion transport protein